MVERSHGRQSAPSAAVRYPVATRPGVHRNAGELICEAAMKNRSSDMTTIVTTELMGR